MRGQNNSLFCVMSVIGSYAINLNEPWNVECGNNYGHQILDINSGVFHSISFIWINDINFTRKYRRVFQYQSQFSIFRYNLCVISHQYIQSVVSSERIPNSFAQQQQPNWMKKEWGERKNSIEMSVYCLINEKNLKGKLGRCSKLSICDENWFKLGMNDSVSLC